MSSRREEMLREELGRWRVLAGDLAVADDIVPRLREACGCLCPHCSRENAYAVGSEAAAEIERLRAEARAFTVRPGEVLVLIAPDGLTPAEAKALKDECPELHGRIIVIGKMAACRG